MELSSFFPIWGKLTDKQRETLSKSATVKKIPKDTVIHDGSNDCMGLLLVCSGQLRACILSDEGKQITVYRLFAYDMCLFSASCMMKSIQFDITISAEKDTEVFLVPLEVYKSLMEESAVIANFTNEVMGTRFTDVMWLVQQIMWKSFDKRLAEFLLNEAEIEDSNTLTITHEQIAAHLGSAREVVTRMLKYFRSEGLVELSRGAVCIIDADGLNKLINGGEA